MSMHKEKETPKNLTPRFKSIGLIVVLVVIFTIMYILGFVGDSKKRISLEHSIVIPSSVIHPKCESFFNLSMIDSGAMATFEIPDSDVHLIFDQFSNMDKIDNRNQIPAIGSNSVPSNFQNLSSTWTGKSKSGNAAYIDIYKIGENYSGICLRTIWN